ncbi:MAG: NTP transferase domain-containing protein [Alphaproteobacteria bacterium]|nr:NTP transferase domain-containing protein [Alphaproteobacteria bacterium]
MTTACIVQARMGSTRLPGKVLRRLGDDTVLRHVLRRCAAIPGVDVVVCATVVGADGERVAAEALRSGALVFRGDEADVLGRYLGAAEMVDATRIMRVTSDCPLIDPVLCGRVLALCGGANGADFATNNMPPSWPHGLDCEAFTRDLLEAAAATAEASYDREHVSPWMQQAAGVRRANLAGPGGELTQHRWTLDYPEDFAFFAALFPLLPPPPALPGMEQVLDVLAMHPGLSRLNQHRSAA